MSIFPLFLLVGVSRARHISYYVDTAALQPIVTRSQEHRICAELCMTGLGGAPCGVDCYDLTPQGLPLQSVGAPKTANISYSAARHDSCNILCENNLGYPLCTCGASAAKSGVKTDFVKVCSHFCVRYDYRIYGCQACELYKNSAFDTFSANLSGDDDEDQPVVDWELWCQKMCQGGDGGAACNCDLLPMSLDV